MGDIVSDLREEANPDLLKAHSGPLTVMLRAADYIEFQNSKIEQLRGAATRLVAALDEGRNLNLNPRVEAERDALRSLMDLT